MSEEVKRELRDLAQEALQIQDACNLSGLIHSWSRSVTDLRRLLANAGTHEINTHPINTLWIDKLAQLNGVITAPPELIAEAFEAVRRIAEM